MEQVLQNMNRLNRNLESIITVRSPRLASPHLPSPFHNAILGSMANTH